MNSPCAVFWYMCMGWGPVKLPRTWQGKQACAVPTELCTCILTLGLLLKERMDRPRLDETYPVHVWRLCNVTTLEWYEHVHFRTLSISFLSGIHDHCENWTEECLHIPRPASTLHVLTINASATPIGFILHVMSIVCLLGPIKHVWLGSNIQGRVPVIGSLQEVVVRRLFSKDSTSRYT